MDIFKNILSLIGFCTVAMIMVSIIELMHSKIKYWREYKTKIQWLCKPHVYMLDWIWNDKEAVFKCTKCNKIKKMYIDKKSFEEWFKKEDKDAGSI